MKARKIINSLQRRGLKGSIKRFYQGREKMDVIGMWGFITDTKETPFSLEDYKKHKEGNQITLNWVIPEMGEGSGGHLNIFRFVSYLERHGVHNRMYLFRHSRFQSDESLREFVHKYFSILDENVELYYDTKMMKFADGTVATSWDTAYCVRNFNNTISKFYFIQDFEPHFFAHGSEYEFAEQTYKFGFRGITAGDWLKDICINDYNMVLY